MTARYHVGYGLQFLVDPGDDFDSIVDKFYEQLLEIEARDGEIIDPDLAASLRDYTISVEMLVDADGPVTANLCALTAVRAALHTIEVGTPGWDLTIASMTADIRSSEDMLQDA